VSIPNHTGIVRRELKLQEKIGKREGKRSLGNPSGTQDDNVMMDLMK
jgi:hypothetical protein